MSTGKHILTGVVGRGYAVADPVKNAAQQLVRAFTTGEFRAPRKGEWYISGAIPEAYRAPGDFTEEMCFHIARIYRVRRVTKYEVLGEVKGA